MTLRSSSEKYPCVRQHSLQITQICTLARVASVYRVVEQQVVAAELTTLSVLPTVTLCTHRNLPTNRLNQT